MSDSSDAGLRESEIRVEESGSALPDVDECSAALMISRFSLYRHWSARVLDELPPIAVVPDEGRPCPILDVIAAEWETEAPGRQLVLEGSSEVLLLITLREWVAEQTGHSSPFAFSHAFTKHHQTRPTDFRRKRQ